jgi:hypothetical protein
VDRLPVLVEDLVRRGVVLIATASTVPSALAAKTATSTIPIVFVMGADPVENELVASLARPCGNVTGVTGADLAKPGFVGLMEVTNWPCCRDQFTQQCEMLFKEIGGDHDAAVPVSRLAGELLTHSGPQLPALFATQQPVHVGMRDLISGCRQIERGDG